MRPGKLVRPEVLALKGYQVPEAQGMVKLDAMENPTRCRPRCGANWPKRCPRRSESLPRADGRRVRELLARRMNLPSGMELLLGNGSDDLIQIITLAVARPGTTMMYPAPTFVMYGVNAALCGMKAVAVPLREDFSFDADAFIARMKSERPALVFIAYPNNPTGALYPEEGVLRVIGAAEGIVVLDEAYHVFAGRTFMQRLGEHPNLVVLRTLSKLGLAGIRWAISPAGRNGSSSSTKCGRPTTSMSSPRRPRFHAGAARGARRAGGADQGRARNARPGLAGLPGVTVFPSQANFFLVRVPRAERTYEALKRQGVLVRNLHPGLRDCLRITVGTPDENRILLTALQEAL